MIQLRRMAPADLAAVRALRVAPKQQAFVDPIDETLGQIKAGEACYVVTAEEEVVGFFLIDADYAVRYSYARPRDLGLQVFFIDVGHQGKGYGKATLETLPARLAIDYPDRAALVLTVNCRNRLAYSLYRAIGFDDAGELYHGGRSGPQHVLRLGL